MERPSSVWEGNDSGLLSWAIPFYHGIYDPIILDCTYGKGTFWKGFERGTLFGSDLISKALIPMGWWPVVVADFRSLPFRNRTFDVVVFDPPHLTDGGKGSLYSERYETGEKAKNISYLFPPFLREAKRVLRPNGIVLAKIADQVHGGKSQWQHVDFMRDAEEAGLTVCDMIVKVRKSAVIDPKWKNVYHARKRHAMWIVCRKGKC